MRLNTERNYQHRWNVGQSVKSAFLLSALLTILIGSVTESPAAFSLNWQRDYAAEGASFVSNDAYVVCNMSYLAAANCGGGWGGDVNLAGAHIDNTAFLQEQLDLGGQRYFHVIVGDYNTDSMAQEVFIKVNAGNADFDPTFGTVRVSDSLSDITQRTYNTTKPYSPGGDSAFSGTGSANPNSVIMRQVLNENTAEGVVYEEFLKDAFTQKPKITHTISTADMDSTLIFDMRSKSYADATALDTLNPAQVTNTVVLKGANRFGTTGDYNINTMVDTTIITAAKFTYVNGTGPGNSGGSYTYADPFVNFNQPTNLNYASFCKPAENPNWSGNGACVNGDGTSGGGGWGW